MRRWSAALAVTALVVAGCGGGEPSSRSETSVTEPAGRQQLVLTWVGDNILGTDDRFDAGSSLPAVWAANGDDPGYFFQNVKSYFEKDDLTVANVEVALTKRGQKIDKGGGEYYHFRGDPAIAKTLPAASIEAATLANNHTGDYGQVGYDDTVATLKGVGVAPFGDELTHIADVKGVKIGLFGHSAWEDTPDMRAQLKRDIDGLRQRGADVVVPFMHWGIEATDQPYDVQIELAKFLIDNGADMVIGSHPHVLQSLAVYKGRLIAYSLANFSFGGNNNPTDKRTIILQTRVDLDGKKVSGVEYRVIPTRVSRTDAYNDFVPTPYTGAEATEVLSYLNGISPTLRGGIRAQFTPVPK